MTRRQLTQRMKRCEAAFVWVVSGYICRKFVFIFFCVFCHLQIAFDEGTDEFSSYFNGLTNPKVLITTSDRPRGVSGCCRMYCLTLLHHLTRLTQMPLISKYTLEEIAFDLVKLYPSGYT